MGDVLQDKAGGYTGSSGDQADLDFHKVGAMEQPGFGKHGPAPVARVLQLVMIDTGKDKTMDGAYQFIRYFADASQQAKWSMATGYIPVRKSTLEIPGSASHDRAQPHASGSHIPGHASPPDLVDLQPGRQKLDALAIAADQVEIEDIPAREALNEAARTAQAALNAVNQPQ